MKRKRGKLLGRLSALDRGLVVLLQELKSWRDDVVGNLRVLSELGKDCAIWIPSSWTEALGDVVHGEYFTLAD